MASLAARLEMREGRPAASVAALGQAIAVAPRSDLFMLRADARHQLGDLAGAVADAAEAVIHDRHNPAAKALLGILMTELGHPEDAARCLAEAVEAVPANPMFRRGLANALLAAGQPAAAAATYAAGIAAAPGNLDLRNAAIMLAVRQRDFANAVALAEAARVVAIADATTFGLMGHALCGLGRHEEAADAYADALRLAPNDPIVRRMMVAADIRPDATRVPAASVRRVFDGYADRFERHLIDLGYRIPGVMRNALRAHLSLDAGEVRQGGAFGGEASKGETSTDETFPGEALGAKPIGPVLDLGCGTGMVAVALMGLNLGPFVGVDLSPHMLRLAAAKHLYAGLHESDIIDFLKTDTRQWPLILAADVLCYLGALEPLFAATYARLLPGGLFMCSAEELVGPYIGNGDWVLGRMSRFAHARNYISRVARTTGFTVRAIDAEVQRNDAGAPVPGFLVVLERPHGNG